jgi:hypothetical protein
MTPTQSEEISWCQEDPAMPDNDCSAMEVHCLERARMEPLNRGKWIAQAERWHELARVQNSWRLQKRPPQQSMHTEPMATQRQQG